MGTEEARKLHAKTYILAGRRYLLSYLRLRAKKVKAKGKDYRQYYINVPKGLVELLLEGREPPEPGSRGILLTALLTVSPWYHALDWSQLSVEDLHPRVKKEIRALGLDKLEKPLVLIPVEPDRLRELGLDPNISIIFDDLVEAVKRKAIEGS